MQRLKEERQQKGRLGYPPAERMLIREDVGVTFGLQVVGCLR